MESTADTNGDGLADVINFEIEIEVKKSGEITLEGNLHSGQKELSSFTYATVTKVLDIGRHTLTLSAKSDIIRQKRLNGPYFLELQLYEAEEEVDRIYRAHQTQEYSSYTDFEGGSAEFEPDSFNDEGIDPDNDGFFNVLRIGVSTMVKDAGEYYLVGHLSDQDGNLITETNSQASLETGQQTINLDFSGETINLYRVNGPYLLKYAILYGESLSDTLPTVYSTSAYSYENFQAPPIGLTGKITDTAFDDDGDGTNDRLVVEIEAVTPVSGTYGINARLVDKQGNEIVWASNFINLAANVAVMLSLEFQAQDIYNHGVNGPYLLRDIYLYNKNNSEIETSLDEYTTTSIWKFANEPPVSDPGNDSSVIEEETFNPDGSGSHDPDDDPLSYFWKQLEGIPVELSDVNSATPTFTAPSVTEDEVLSFELSVSDGKETSTSSVKITINPKPGRQIVTGFGKCLYASSSSATVKGTTCDSNSNQKWVEL